MNNKGNSSISAIILMMLIMLLIILPIVSMVFENYYISIITREVVDASYSAMTSSFDNINIGISTRNRLSYSFDIEENFLEFLKINLNLSKDFETSNQRFKELEIIEFTNLYLGEADEINGSVARRDTIHILMRIKFESMFLMLSSSEERIVNIHFDYEVPIDN